MNATLTRLTKQYQSTEHEELIEAEAQLDTLIESTPVSKTKAYESLRAAVNQLQIELEAKGIKGKWRAWHEPETPTPAARWHDPE